MSRRGSILGPDTKSAAARHRECRGPTQRVPGPDTASAGARHRKRWGPDTESAGAGHRPRSFATKICICVILFDVFIRKFNHDPAYLQCCSPLKAGHDAAPGPTQSDGDRRSPTQRAPGPDTGSLGARHRERWGPTQRAPGPDTERAGARHTAPGPDTDKHRDCRGLTHRAPVPKTSVERSPLSVSRIRKPWQGVL